MKRVVCCLATVMFVFGGLDITQADPVKKGLQLWLKADAGVKTSGDRVKTWSDQSGNGHRISAKGDQRPALVADVLNGLPAVHFNGTNQLNGELGQKFRQATIFAIARWTLEWSDNDYLYTLGSCCNSGSQMTLSRRAGVRAYHFDGWFENFPVGTEIPFNEFQYFSQVFGGDSKTSHQLYQNGNLILSTKAQNRYDADGELFVIGNWSEGAWRLHGDVVEFLIYDRILSAHEYQQVEKYLTARLNGSLAVTGSNNKLLTQWATIKQNR